MVLYSPLTITEHHHDSLDLCPDFNRQIRSVLGRR
ncbi:hypothetical protein [Cryobacterium sp. PH31-L1]